MQLSNCEVTDQVQAIKDHKLQEDWLRNLFILLLLLQKLNYFWVYSTNVYLVSKFLEDEIREAQISTQKEE